jgi:hypothetical protein
MTIRQMARCALLLVCAAALFAAAPVSTTVSGALSLDGQQFSVTSVTGLAAGYEVYIDKEAMLIGSINGRNLTVYRGFDGTRPARHAAGTAIVGGPTTLFVRQSPSGSCDASVYVDTLLDVTTGFTNTCTGGLWVSSGGSGGGGAGVPPGYTAVTPAASMTYTATANAPIQQWASTLTANVTSSNVVTTGFPAGGLLKWRLCNDSTPRTHVVPTVNGSGSVGSWPGMPLSANVCERISADWDGTNATVTSVRYDNLGGIGEGADLTNGTAPPTPAAGKLSYYAASADKKLHVIDDTGTDTALGAGGGSSNFRDYQKATSVNMATGTDVDIYSTTVSAAALPAGRCMTIAFVFQKVGANGGLTTKLWWGGTSYTLLSSNGDTTVEFMNFTVCNDPGATNSQQVIMTTPLFYGPANSVPNLFNPATQFATAAIDTTASAVLKITGNGTTGDTVSAKSWIVQVQ